MNKLRLWSSIQNKARYEFHNGLFIRVFKLLDVVS